MTEIDRLARALNDAGEGYAHFRFEDLVGIRRDQVRAVLLALREPTDGMMEAGFEAMFTSPWDGSQAPMMGAGWQAMIDHILNERDGQ